MCGFSDVLRSLSKFGHSDCNVSTLLHPANHLTSLFEPKHFLSNPTQIIARTHKSERRWSCATENKKLIAIPCMKYALCWHTPTLSVWISPLRADSLACNSPQALLPLLRLTSLRGYSLPRCRPWQRWYCSNIPQTSGLDINHSYSRYWWYSKTFLYSQIKHLSHVLSFSCQTSPLGSCICVLNS